MPGDKERRLVAVVHAALTGAVKPGDRVIDATAGNGHDTLHLARLVGPQGRVLAIDLQPQAIEATRRRLLAAGLSDRVELALADHADIDALLAARERTAYAGAVFNLGYLPGSDHSVRTGAPGTITALHACASRLRGGGLLCVTAYRGHPGGAGEAEAVADWMAGAVAQGWSVRRESPGNPDKGPPVLWLASSPEPACS